MEKKAIYLECCRPWETEEHLLLVGSKGWRVCPVPVSFCVEGRPLVYHLGLSPGPHSPLSRSPNDLSNPWSLGTETRDREPVTVLVPSYPLDAHISVFSNILAIWEQASMWGSHNRPAPPVSSQARPTMVEFSTRKPVVDAYLSHLLQYQFCQSKKWCNLNSWRLLSPVSMRPSSELRRTGKPGCHLLPPNSNNTKNEFFLFEGKIWYLSIFENVILLLSNLWGNRTILTPKTLTCFHFIQNMNESLLLLLFQPFVITCSVQPLTSSSWVHVSVLLTIICKMGIVIALPPGSDL